MAPAFRGELGEDCGRHCKVILPTLRDIPNVDEGPFGAGSHADHRDGATGDVVDIGITRPGWGGTEERRRWIGSDRTGEQVKGFHPWEHARAQIARDLQ